MLFPLHLPLQAGDRPPEQGHVVLQKGEEAACKEDQEGDGEHIADKSRREGLRRRQTGGQPKGDAPAELHDGEHGDQDGEYKFAQLGGGKPL